jgi:hypothetical protein
MRASSRSRRAAVTLAVGLAVSGLGAPSNTIATADASLVEGPRMAPVTTEVGQPPVAHDDPGVPMCSPSVMFGGTYPIAEDHEQTAFVGGCAATANDTDADGTIVSWAIDTPPAHGELEWTASVPGVFGYTADPDYSTARGDQPGGAWVSDSFTYHVIDDQGLSSNEATYRFWIAPVNDAPTFTPGVLVIGSPEDGSYSQPWATQIDAGPSESTQSVAFVLDIGPGFDVGFFSVLPAIDQTGRLTFTPAPNRTGSMKATFALKDDGGLENYGAGAGGATPDDTSDAVTIDIGINAVNDEPSAAADAATVTEDQATATTIAVLANDSDVDGDALSVTAKTNGAKGAVAIGAGGSSVTYTPNANAFGADTFTYAVGDGQGGTATASVSVTINSVNDDPNAVDDGVPTAYGMYLRTPPTAVPVLVNDTSAPDLPETLTIVGVTQGAHGTAAITGGGTGVTYQPIGTMTGLDEFSYTLSDGHGGTDEATVHVAVGNDVTAPTVRIAKVWSAALRGRPTARVAVTWTLADPQSGIANQFVQRRIDGGAWTTVPIAMSTTRTLSIGVLRGHTVEFRVRANDRAGNQAPYVMSAPIRT